jgi:dipeptidyl aminopeptidase/acylaminoacyl peptidase
VVCHIASPNYPSSRAASNGLRIVRASISFVARRYALPVRYVAKASGEEGTLPLKPLSPSKYEGLGITPEIAHFKSKDGLSLAGILYKSADYQAGKRYPTVIWAHGGTEAQAVLSLTPSLFLADHGYLVLEPNFRGSTGYGEHFRNLNVKDSGGGEIEDIEAAVSYLVNAGLADPKRVAIGGGSHGGTVVANAVTKLPDTFAAGIEMFWVVDRALFLEYTNRNSKIRWETKMGGTPVEQPAVYRKANILPDVFGIKTPLLILHGEQDPQVPPRESAEFAEALTKAGKTHIYNYVSAGRTRVQEARASNGRLSEAANVLGKVPYVCHAPVITTQENGVAPYCAISAVGISAKVRWLLSANHYDPHTGAAETSVGRG